MTVKEEMVGALTKVYERTGLGMEDSDWSLLRPITAEELVRAIETGTVVNAGGDPGRVESIPSDEDISGRYLDLENEPPIATATLDGETLRAVLMHYAGKTRGEAVYDPRGLRIERVAIVGEMNWAWLDIPFPVGFWGCAFGRFSMDVDHARVPRLVFDSCYFGRPLFGASAFNATETVFDSAIRFLDCEGLGQLFLLDCTLATFELRDHPGSVEDDFRLVLNGSTIDEFIVSADRDPSEMIPAKHGLRDIRINRLELGSWDPQRRETDDWKPTWIADWLAGGRVPHALRGERSVREKLNPHQRQVWAEFAAALDRKHLEREAVSLRISAERHRDARRPWITRALRWLTLDVTVRYFQRNVRALGWLALTWLGVAVLAWFNIRDLYRDGSSGAPLGPLEAGSDGVLWAMAYGLDIVVSPLQLGFDAVWPTAPLLIVIFALLKLFAISMFGLFIVGISGVVQRNRAS